MTHKWRLAVRATTAASLLAAGGTMPHAAPMPAPAHGAAAAGNADIVDVFGVRTWEPPPPPPPPPSESKPMAAQPPPLPFRYFGRIAEPGKPVAFLLLDGERIVQAKVGDTIDGRYRLAKFDGGRLYFRYRPMNATQVLAIGDAP